MLGTVGVPALEWLGARAGKCYANADEMVRQRGGRIVFGWALTEYGPMRQSGWYPPPLYRRWLNHVVWEDPAGNLWEVTPNLDLDNHRDLSFRETEFLIDPEATFDFRDHDQWDARPCRYVAVRPEGERIAKLLNQAQHTPEPEPRLQLIELALAELRAQGFEPLGYKLETMEERTGSIWLVAH